MLAPFREAPDFKDVLYNIFLVVDFFNAKVPTANMTALVNRCEGYQ